LEGYPHTPNPSKEINEGNFFFSHNYIIIILIKDTINL
jgi:hypothetical protein